MAFNQEAGSDLGVSLCHTHFGSLYEKEGKYDLAKEEYEKAYGLMKESEDEYHALNSLLAMAGIHITTGEYSSAMEYLVKAESMADRIGSKEHIIEADLLYYDLYKKRGDYKRALQRLEMADSVKNSVMSVENINRVQNNLLTIERNRRSTQINEARLKLENERDKRRFLYVLLSFVVLFFTAVILVLMYIQRLRERNHSALMRMSTMREHFFTNITHEFRTPLTVILGLSDQIKKNDSLATETREKASVIERQGNGLLALVNQLMDISKIKSAVGDPDWRHGDITTYIAMVMESWKEVALSRNIDLQYTQSGPVEMDFVPEYINKVLANLLSNAFKFTPEYGRVDVSVKRDGPRLLMDVSDTGVGVDEESIAHIFEPFYQARNAASHIGSGVGLALVKQIMDSLEGTVSVGSSLGKGTVFHLVFPITNNHVRPFEAPEPIIDEYEDSDALADANDEDGKPRVLIIEDNRDVAAYIGSGLLNDYSVFYARDGKEGYDKTLELVPDLIITDLMMPGMSGLDICRSVRKQDIVSHIPIIVVTAKASEEDKIKGIEAGADAYIPKPFNSDELAAWVDKLLKDRRRLRELYVRKMIEAKDDAKEKKDTALNEADLRFLSKLADTVIMRLDRGSDIEIPTLASSMCMSVSQFYRKMTALTGFSPAAYILRLRIKKAQQLIDENTEMTLGEVADETGFKDYSNFVRAFKNIRGLTPSEYRGSKNLP